MKKYLLPVLLAASIAPSQAAIVFADDFSEAAGTAVVGKLPDVGLAYTGNTGVNITANNTLSTAGAPRIIYGGFTSTLGAGQILTLSFDSINLSNLFTAGYAGVSLFAGTSERIFVGDAGGDSANLSWAVAGPAAGTSTSGNNVGTTSVVFTYTYNTGAWTLTTTSGVNLTGTASSNEAINQLRIANGGGGDIELDNLVVDISPVPEPSATVLLGLGVLGGTMIRRRSR